MGAGGRALARGDGPGRVAPFARQEESLLRALLATALRERDEHEHELRSALLAVEAAGRILAARLTQLGEAADAELAIAVEDEAARMQRLVSGAHDETVGACGVLDALRSLVVAHRATGLRIAVDLPPELRVVVRPHVLAEVVGNLLANSARHAPGARVSITAVEHLGPGFVRLLVADDGPGFPPDALARGTERGWRGAGTATPGSGLGLYLAARLVEREGGALTLLRPRPGATGAVVAVDLRAAGAAGSYHLEGLADAS